MLELCWQVVEGCTVTAYHVKPFNLPETRCKGVPRMLPFGLYEQVINRLIARALDQMDDPVFRKETGSIDEAQSVDVLAQYLACVVEAGLASIPHAEALHRRVEICNTLIKSLAHECRQPHIEDFLIRPDAKLLLALRDGRQVLSAAAGSRVEARPCTSLARSSLFTGAANEPSMVAELKKEILSSDRVDMLVSFIKWSGLRLLMDELQEFTKFGQLRVVTTSYMGATDIKAIDELQRLANTTIHVSYDTERTRLHAKAYIFHRESGFSTAYVGSSNLSKAALETGLEWNVKIAAKDLGKTYAKISATFDSYWHDASFAPYGASQRPMLVRALNSERAAGSDDGRFVFDIRPYEYQKAILERLEADRCVRGQYRNLIVAATGTGKTVIAAFDYKRFCAQHPGRANRLLFVAHRAEILRQSLDCFRTVLHDQNFGELFVGGHEPTGLEHLFMSIQTFNARDVAAHTSPEYFDYIVVDEFHHAAAGSYQRLLSHYRPEVMLGLTATPERLDGKDITEYFDQHIAAEIRLPQAIDQGLLAPFQYFGVTDSVDLSTLRWRRGGYDTGELNQLYTNNHQRAQLIIRSLRRYVTDLDQVRGLGFCVSIAHAQFMAEIMNHHGIASMALHAGSTDEQRLEAKRRLVLGEVRFIFVVDLYNEGVDIPEVNTILFLRPTESLTVFLQQLGRGLRMVENKDCLTVLDFVGQSHQRYRFEEKFAALLRRSRLSVQKQVQEGFLHVPRGCFIQLERQAKQYILDNIETAIRGRGGFVGRIRTFAEDSGLPLTLANFLDYYHLTPRTLYGAQATSFARLCAQAELGEDFSEPDETALSKALVRFSGVNSRRWIDVLLGWFDLSRPLPQVDSAAEQRMLLMLHYTVWQKPFGPCGFASLIESLAKMRGNRVLCAELCDLLRYNLQGIDFVDEPLDLGFGSVLDLHCAYTRDQVLAAFDVYTADKMPAMREGVRYLADKKLDLFFITLNKSDKEYSPSTMYQDYAINEHLFHWQSQSGTDADAPTGQRYIHHQKTNDRVVLFVRDCKSDASGALPYTYLGLADYLQHTGSRPMNITWRLQRPIPAALMPHVRTPLAL